MLAALRIEMASELRYAAGSSTVFRDPLLLAAFNSEESGNLVAAVGSLLSFPVRITVS